MIDLSKIEVNNPEGIPDEIVVKLCQMMENENKGRKVIACSVRKAEGEDMYGITPTFAPIPFDRIRRVTGYLAGDVRSFNDAKRAEERDRVKHDVSLCTQTLDLVQSVINQRQEQSHK